MGVGFERQGGRRFRALSRRAFLGKAAMAGAAAAAMPIATGCADTQRVTAIPCLAKVDAPTPLPGMRYLRASEIGCALNCDLSSGEEIHGGGSATDDGPRINAALAGATAANPITLIIDGGALISGLNLPPAGHWSIVGLGCGTGFFIKSGANSDGIRNELGLPHDIDAPGPAPARGSDVTLSNFTLNGNAGDGRTGNSNSGNPLGGQYWLLCINLVNLNNVTITNIVIVNSPAYHMRLSNVGNVTVTGCVMHSRGLHTDGVHFDGPANDISIDGCDVICDDDAFAFNCPEGYTGNIERVSITNCTFDSFRFVRLDTDNGTGNPGYLIHSVAISGCSGTCAADAIIMGEAQGIAPDAIDNVTVTDCKITAPAAIELACNFGSVAISGLTFTPSGDVGSGYAMVRSEKGQGPLVSVGSSLTFTNCTIARQKDVAAVALQLLLDFRVSVAEFSGFSVVDAAGAKFAPLPGLVQLVEGSIAQLGLDSVAPAQLAAAVAGGDFAGVESVAGLGVLATGWKFPDAVMANGSPYLSADSGQASVKVNGVVKPYP